MEYLSQNNVLILDLNAKSLTATVKIVYKPIRMFSDKSEPMKFFLRFYRLWRWAELSLPFFYRV